MVNPDIFNDVPIFALLDADERQVLAQQVSARNFAKGETVFKAGEPGSHAYLVQYGKVSVSITDLANEEIIVDVAEAGGVVGMSSLLAHANHLTTAIAIEDTCAIEIDRGDISTLLQQKPLAGLDMMTMIESQLRATHELMRTRVSRNLNTEMEEAETLGDHLADLVAKFWRVMEICNQLWRYHGRLHFYQCYDGQALGPVSVYLAQPVLVDAGSDPSPGYYDEPESPRYQRSDAERVGLQC